jgi:hypothetical protein
VDDLLDSGDCEAG